MIPAILYYFVKKMSIKTVKFLRYFISQNQKLPSALAGKVAALSQKAHSEPQVKGQILFFQVLHSSFFFSRFSSVPDLIARTEQMVIIISRYCII